jgi:hypothetical protein
VGTRSLVLIALIGGALSGTVVSAGLGVWLSRGSREPTATAPPQNVTRAPDRGVSTGYASAVRAVENRWAEMDQRVVALEERSSAEAGAERTEAPLEEEAGAESTRERFARRLEEHKQEQVDPEWARSTDAELRSDLVRVAKLGDVVVSQISCRNTTCTAQAEWPDRATALRDYTLLVHVPFRVNCGRSLILPEPSPGETKVTASLLLDCESWRAEGSPLLDEHLVADLRFPSRMEAPDSQAE